MYSLVQIQSTNTHMMMAIMVQARLTTGIMISRWVPGSLSMQGQHYDYSGMFMLFVCFPMDMFWMDHLDNYEPNPVYSGAHLIHTANAWKNHANYPSMWIIYIRQAYFMLHSYEWQRVVSRATMQIKQGMWISEGQIIWDIL